MPEYSSVYNPKMKHYCHQIFLFVLVFLLVYVYLRNGMIIKEKLSVKKVNIFVLAGQSNMAGRGGVKNKVWDEYVPIECREDRRILRLSANSELEVAKEPLHEGIDVNKSCGIGPGMAFANAILEKDPDFGMILLVPCAVGGTSITEWSSDESWLRSRMIERTNDALRYGGKLRAILWYQGEKDTETEDAALHVFPGEYQRFRQRLYEELMHPNVPFIQVALASGQGKQEWLENVRATQIAAENVITVDAIGLPLEPGGLHLSTDAQVHLGNMLADAFLENIV